MIALVYRILRYSGLPIIMRMLFQRNKVTILVFHEMTPEVGETNFTYLKKHYNIISLQTFYKAIENNDSNLLPKKSLIITFDDGRISNFELLPVIKKLKIPVTIFLNSGIINTNRHYWFRYNRELFSNESLKKISNKDRLALMHRHGFKQDQEYDYPQALSKAQIVEMSEYVDMQSHTSFHPCLPKCDYSEAKFEIENCKKTLEKEYGFTINTLAYPNGDYTEREIEIAKQAGYKYCLSIDKGYNSIFSDIYRLKRLDPNDTDNLDEFIVKTSGLHILPMLIKLQFQNLFKHRAQRKISKKQIKKTEPTIQTW
ncbi:polysaccharide deacetylase family protein [Algoriphagus sp. AGSA1]|uniref:polysaccharide deacetylase family protein n=1 Tax=Algoriphagus sp. AGSA1 TaxID=2907213 RepID=UPI001F15DCCB|nr:polysaccharide deacetylase family protein [Algoriphagus sp. AGSA1]MCE7053269.1 polysaccharide deacetylase family protein [Algoriphagus sp. AGSA1]